MRVVICDDDGDELVEVRDIEGTRLVKLNALLATRGRKKQMDASATRHDASRVAPTHLEKI